MKLIKDAYHAWNAEVVFITSNWQGNKELMEGCKEAGIPAFVRLSPAPACMPASQTHARALLPSAGHTLGFLNGGSAGSGVRLGVQRILRARRASAHCVSTTSALPSGFTAAAARRRAHGGTSHTGGAYYPCLSSTYLIDPRSRTRTQRPK